MTFRPLFSQGLPTLQVTPSKDFLPDKNSESKDSFALEGNSINLKEITDDQPVEEAKTEGGSESVKIESLETDLFWIKTKCESDEITEYNQENLENQPFQLEPEKKVKQKTFIWKKQKKTELQRVRNVNLRY